jgi:hypothetical protein
MIDLGVSTYQTCTLDSKDFGWRKMEEERLQVLFVHLMDALMYRHTGHHRIMEAPKSPRDDGFIAVWSFSTHTSESPAQWSRM